MNTQQLFGFSETHLALWSDARFTPAKQYKLHLDMCAYWQLMIDAAAGDGLRLVIVSGFRDFSRQLLIWNEKFAGRRPVHDDAGHSLQRGDFSDANWCEKILRYSALPGLSRHHWGTDVDVFDQDALQRGHRPQLTAAEFGQGGPCADLELWLRARAADFGFYRPYQMDRGGVAVEPWHLSFAALALQAERELNADALRACLQQVELAGKDCVLPQLDYIIQRYARPSQPDLPA